MLPGKERSHQELPAPAQLLLRIGAQHDRAKALLSTFGQLQADVQAGAGPKLAGDFRDERVPLFIGSEIRQRLPDLGHRRLDFDFGADLHAGDSFPKTSPSRNRLFWFASVTVARAST